MHEKFTTGFSVKKMKRKLQKRISAAAVAAVRIKRLPDSFIPRFFLNAYFSWMYAYFFTLFWFGPVI
jgi:hypothetical protein